MNGCAYFICVYHTALGWSFTDLTQQHVDETVIFLAPLMKHVQHRSGTRSPTRDVDVLIQGIMSTSPYRSPILGARLHTPLSIQLWLDAMAHLVRDTSMICPVQHQDWGIVYVTNCKNFQRITILKHPETMSSTCGMWQQKRPHGKAGSGLGVPIIFLSWPHYIPLILPDLGHHANIIGHDYPSLFVKIRCIQNQIGKVQNGHSITYQGDPRGTLQ